MKISNICKEILKNNFSKDLVSSDMWENNQELASILSIKRSNIFDEELFNL